MNYSQDSKALILQGYLQLLRQLDNAKFPMPSNNMERFIHTDHVRYSPVFLSTEARLLTVKIKHKF